ncbi:hypothetical protein SPI_03512 [Niveomyces insectorum RCEF 264]|uniref:Uncharacterized protein n=1 Tax=Niveomyces insectorum RCEF 264 TaxID=1081102 RepID=A0A167W538_9HYPO|nr:hypothetical protein SPI_03512 [Niveomyces insectorum RCEF 264]
MNGYYQDGAAYPEGYGYGCQTCYAYAHMGGNEDKKNKKKKDGKKHDKKEGKKHDKKDGKKKDDKKTRKSLVYIHCHRCHESYGNEDLHDHCPVCEHRFCDKCPKEEVVDTGH